MSKKRTDSPENKPQIENRRHITTECKGTKPTAPETMEAIKQRRTRSPKKKSYTTKNGTRHYYEGYAYATLASGGKFITGKGDTPKEATNQALINAYGKEQAEKLALQQESSSHSVVCQEAVLPNLALIQEHYIDYCIKRKRVDTTIEKYSKYSRYFNELRLDPSLPPMGEWDAEMMTEHFELMQIAHDELVHAGVSPNTVRGRWTYVSSVMNHAHKRRWSKGNPIQLIDIVPRKKKGKLRVSGEHAVLLMRAAGQDHAMRSALILALCYGQRRQEICGVTSDDIAGHKLVINRQLKRVKYHGAFGPGDIPPPADADYTMTKDGWLLCLGKPKAGLSDVEYDLTTEIEEVFYKALDDARPTVVWDAVDRKWRKVWFVVHAPKGKATEGQRLRDRFVELCRKENVDAVLHGLRALFASTAITDGVGVELTSRLLRHESIRTTQIYLRGLDTAVAGASRKVASQNQRLLGLGSDPPKGNG